MSDFEIVPYSNSAINGSDVDSPRHSKKIKSTLLNSFGNEAADIHHVRSELSYQVQAMQHQQDAKIHSLENQLGDIEKKIAPDLQKLDLAQEEAGNQLERVRERIKRLQSDELIPLVKQYDQLSTEFDRFVRVEVESKIKPMHDDIRASRNKLNDLSLSAENSFVRIDESLKSLVDKLDGTEDGLKDQQARVNSQIDDLIPKIGSLEHKIEMLNNLLDDSPQISSGSATLNNQLQKTNEILTRLSEEIIPNKINDTSNHFDNALSQLGEYCKGRINEITEKLHVLKDDNHKINEDRKKTETTIGHLLRSSSDSKEKLLILQDSLQAKLHKVETDMQSALNGMSEKVKDLSSESDNGLASLKSKIEDDVNGRKKQVETSIRRLRDNMKRDISQSKKAQELAMNRINEIRDTLEGEHNCSGRLRDIRSKVKSAIDQILAFDASRREANKRGANPLVIGDRLSNLEERLLNVEERLNKLDGKTAKKPYQIKTIQEKIDPVPETDPPTEKRQHRLPNVIDSHLDAGDDDDEERKESRKERKKRKHRKDYE